MWSVRVLIALLAYWWIGWYVAIAIPFFLGAVFLFSMRSRIPRFWSSLLRLPFQVWLGTGTAMLFVLLFPLVTLLALCGMMAVWDLYAVLRGPLGKMVSGMKEEDKRTRVSIGNMLMAQIGESGIGLGDIVFYSIITMIAFGLSALTGVLVIAVVALGAFITFYISENSKVSCSSWIALYRCCSDSSSFWARGSIDGSVASSGLEALGTSPVATRDSLIGRRLIL